MDSMRNDNDYLLFAGEKEIRSIIKDGKNRKNNYFSEVLLFSDKLIKINRYNMSQERNIVITNKGIYNLKKKCMFVY
jgi:hypothetical protein